MYLSKFESWGNIVRFTVYEKGVATGISGKGRVEKNAKEAEKIRKDSSRRAKRNFLRKIDSTYAFIEIEYPELLRKGWRLRFYTFTFKDAIEDRGDAARKWDNFIKRFKRWMAKRQGENDKGINRISYACTPEIQKKREEKTGQRVWHFHSIIFSPYVDFETLLGMWGLGGCYVEKAKMGDVNRIGAYMGKYMEKDFDLYHYHGKKRYFTSRNVKDKTCVMLYDGGKAVPAWEDMFLSKCEDEKRMFSFEYESKYSGKVKGWEITLPRTHAIRDFLEVFR